MEEDRVGERDESSVGSCEEVSGMRRELRRLVGLESWMCWMVQLTKIPTN